MGGSTIQLTHAPAAQPPGLPTTPGGDPVPAALKEVELGLEDTSLFGQCTPRDNRALFDQSRNLAAELGMVAADDGRHRNAGAAFDHKTGGTYPTISSFGCFAGSAAEACKAIDDHAARVLADAATPSDGGYCINQSGACAAYATKVVEVVRETRP